jgi:type VI secretion system protein ImpH
MASEDRLATAALEQKLLDDSQNYAFFQAWRLLRLRFSDEQEFQDNVRGRPHLGLSFTQRDIENIKRDAQGRYRIESNFFGLYGVTSPLPTFYTEDLIDEQLQGSSASRDFLDILHAALHPLLFQAWEKNRLWMAIHERQSQQSIGHLYALLGMHEAPSELRDQSSYLLRYAGIFNQHPRSALGLKQLVRAVLNEPNIEVIPCAKVRISLPADAQCRLGQSNCLLGENILLGQQMLDRRTSVDIRITPSSLQRFYQLLPGTTGYKQIERLTQLYLPSHLSCRLILRHPNSSAQPSPDSDSRGQRLGIDLWLGASNHSHDITFKLAANLPQQA